MTGTMPSHTWTASKQTNSLGGDQAPQPSPVSDSTVIRGRGRGRGERRGRGRGAGHGGGEKLEKIAKKLEKNHEKYQNDFKNYFGAKRMFQRQKIDRVRISRSRHAY